MQEKAKTIWNDWWLINFLGISLILNIGLWVWLSLKIPADLAEITLHYHALFGPDFFGEPEKLFYLPGIGTAILAVNFAVVFFGYKLEFFAMRMLGFVTLLSEAILLIASLLILGVQ